MWLANGELKWFVTKVWVERLIVQLIDCIIDFYLTSTSTCFSHSVGCSRRVWIYFSYSLGILYQYQDVFLKWLVIHLGLGILLPKSHKMIEDIIAECLVSSFVILRINSLSSPVNFVNLAQRNIWWRYRSPGADVIWLYCRLSLTTQCIREIHTHTTTYTMYLYLMF